MIYSANQLTGFYMIWTLVVKRLSEKNVNHHFNRISFMKGSHFRQKGLWAIYWFQTLDSRASAIVAFERYILNNFSRFIRSEMVSIVNNVSIGAVQKIEIDDCFHDRRKLNFKATNWRKIGITQFCWQETGFMKCVVKKRMWVPVMRNQIILYNFLYFPEN